MQSFCEAYQRIFSGPHWSAQNLATDLARGTAHKCKLLGEFCGLLAWLIEKNVEIRTRDQFDCNKLDSYFRFALEHFHDRR